MKQRERERVGCVFWIHLRKCQLDESSKRERERERKQKLREKEREKKKRR